MGASQIAKLKLERCQGLKHDDHFHRFGMHSSCVCVLQQVDSPLATHLLCQ